MKEFVKHKRQFEDNGFSLLELVTAVGVLLVLTVIGFLAYNGITKNSKQAAVNRAVNEVYDRATGYLLDNDPKTTVQTAEDEYNSSTKFEPGKKRIIIKVDDLGDGRVKVTAVYGDSEARAVRETPSSSNNPVIPDPDENNNPELPIVSSSAVFVFKCDENKGGRLGFEGVSENSEIIIKSDNSTETYTPGGYVGFIGGTEYTVTLTGSYSTYNGENTEAKDCLRKVESFGSGVARISFLGENILEVPETIPDSLINLTAAFKGTKLFNQNLNSWDMSNIENINSMFTDSLSFNNGSDPALSDNPLKWDVSKVKTSKWVFERSGSFNQPLTNANGTGPWDTSNIVDMRSMFRETKVFNQPLDWEFSSNDSVTMMFHGAEEFNQNVSTRTDPENGKIYWDMSNVSQIKDIFRETKKFNNGAYNANDFSKPLKWDITGGSSPYAIFRDAEVFNQQLLNEDGTADWDFSNATSIYAMFENAKAFNNGEPPGANNKPLKWDTSNIDNMRATFNGASSFSQSLLNESGSGQWDTGNVLDMVMMFQDASLFDQDLSNWDVNKVTIISGFGGNNSGLTSAHWPKFKI